MRSPSVTEKVGITDTELARLIWLALKSGDRGVTDTVLAKTTARSDIWMSPVVNTVMLALANDTGVPVSMIRVWDDTTVLETSTLLTVVISPGSGTCRDIAHQDHSARDSKDHRPR